MKIQENIFRSYDIRGIYPSELNEEAVARIARAFVSLRPKMKKIVIARDPRLSSPALFKAIANALVNEGKEVIDIGIAPDPLFFFSILYYNYDGGIVISGSHNPKEYNGLTITMRNDDRVEDVIKERLEKIKELVLENNFQNSEQKGYITLIDPEKDYIDYITSKISLSKPLNIIIDSGNGACGFLPEKIFKKLGCKVKTIYGELDGNFPNHLPDPYDPKNLEDIKKEILEGEFDVGFAFDTDGDRVAPIDNAGRQVTGDSCLWMLAHQALEKKKGSIVHDMRVSDALLEKMKELGVKTYFSVSHHNAVAEKVLETKSVFGGEITYHFLFPLDYYLCDDAIFASLKMAEVTSKQDSFASYIDSIPKYVSTPEIFINCDDDKKAGIIENLKKYLKENNYEFIDVDGARISFKNGWALARISNTTPMIKCRFEGKTVEDLNNIVKESIEIFKEVGIPITEKTYQDLGL